MRKKVLVLALILGTGLLAIFLFSSPVRAQLEQICNIEDTSDLCQENEATQARGDSRGLYGSGSLLSALANLVSLVTGVVGVATLMIGAFRYIRSSGDPSKTSEAQSTIIYAVIGLVVAASARLLVVFVLNRV